MPKNETFTKEQIKDAVTPWMLENIGHPTQLEGDERMRWFETNGMLYAFITALGGAK